MKFDLKLHVKRMGAQFTLMVIALLAGSLSAAVVFSLAYPDPVAASRLFIEPLRYVWPVFCLLLVVECLRLAYSEAGHRTMSSEVVRMLGFSVLCGFSLAGFMLSHLLKQPLNDEMRVASLCVAAAGTLWLSLGVQRVSCIWLKTSLAKRAGGISATDDGS